MATHYLCIVCDKPTGYPDCNIVYCRFCDKEIKDKCQKRKRKVKAGDKTTHSEICEECDIKHKTRSLV